MRYEWDEAKRQSNIEKHGIDLIGIEEVFAGEKGKNEAINYYNKIAH